MGYVEGIEFGRSAMEVKQVDTVLLPFVHAADDAESERVLASLITEHAEPIITKIVNYKMSAGRRGASRDQTLTDAEDIRSDVMLQLVQRLQNFRADYAQRPIASFNSYVAAATYNACDRYVSRKYPQRRRLKNGLRYLLTHREGFALWQDEQDAWVSGFSRWQAGASAGEMKSNGRSNATSADSAKRLQQLRDDPYAFARDNDAQADWSHQKRAFELLSAIFDWTDAPVELDLLTGVVAEWWNVSDETVEIDGEGGDGKREGQSAGVQVADMRPDAASETERRVYLKRLWEEIAELQPRQRAALLLNLRDEQGRGVVDLWMIVGIATPTEVAAVLSMTTEEFAALWSELPLDDNRIAAHLGVTRQQVINLRKSARERLARRTKDF